jgi:CBS domain-containing protein
MDHPKAAKLRRFTESVMTIAKPALVIDGDGMMVAGLSELLTEHRVSCATFVSSGRIVGALSSNDLLRSRYALVRDVMHDVLPIPPTHTIVESAFDLATHALAYLVVVSATKPIAVVRSHDVLAWFAERHGLPSPSATRPRGRIGPLRTST